MQRIVIPLLLALSAPLRAETSVPLVTFGPQAQASQGGDDYTQVIFFAVTAPVEVTAGSGPSTGLQGDAPLYVRLFDPDTGGTLDEAAGAWDTQTRFSLYGGAGAYSTEGVRSGDLIGSLDVGADPIADNRWLSLGPLTLSQAEVVDGIAYFRLVVEGVSGNDGNLFDVSLSLDNKLNRLPEGLRIFSYKPGFSVPRAKDKFAEARIVPPADESRLVVRNFDMENNKLWFEAGLPPELPLRPSAQGAWQEDTLALPQPGAPGAMVIAANPDKHNNAVITARDSQGRPVPIQLPILLQRANTRPVPLADTQFLSDCQSVVFDAGRSSDADRDVLSFSWDFGDNAQASGARVLHRYPGPGRYTYTLTVSDSSGRLANQSQARFELLLNSPPEAVPGERRVAAPGQRVEFDGSASRDADGSLILYTWDFGDSTSTGSVTSTSSVTSTGSVTGGDGPRAHHAYARPGLYQARLRVQDDSQSPCNSHEATVEVWVNAPPLAEAGEPQTVSPGQTVLLDGGRSFDSDGEITAYQWDFGDGTSTSSVTSGEGKQIEHTYSAPGLYEVKLTITDNAGVANSQASDSVKIKVNHSPQAVAKADRLAVAAGEAIAFDANGSRDADGVITAWQWDFGDGSQAQEAAVSHAFAAPGSYTVTLRVTDDSKTSSATHETTLVVKVNAPPVAVAGPDQYLTESLVYFDALASHDTDGEITVYSWDFGDSTSTSSVTGPSTSSGIGAKTQHVYRAPGSYTVTLSVTDDSGTSSRTTQDTLNVRINDKPVADAGPDRLLSPSESAHFDGSASLDPDGQIVNWAWDFGDGASTSSATATSSVTGSSEGAQVEHAYAQPGLYSVTLKVSDDSGHTAAVAYDQALVRVNAQPVANAGPDLLIAPGETARLDGSASYDPDNGKLKYLWRLSPEPVEGTEPVEGIQVNRRFDQPGVYTATLQVDDSSGAANSMAEDSLSIRVNHPPLAEAGDSLKTCDHTIQFDASASSDADNDALRYVWDFGDGTAPQEGVKVSHTYAQGGNYPVTLEVDDRTGLSNARARDSLRVTINQPPTAAAGGELTGCAGEMVLFDASKSRDPEGGNLKYLWELGDASASSAQDNAQTEGMNPARLYKQGGLYPITLRVEDDSGLLACNSATDRALLRVSEAPVAEAGPDQSVCANAPVQFDGSQSRDADGVVNSFDWDFGDGNRSGGQSPTHLYAQPGKYRATLTITGDRQGQCSNSNSDSLAVEVIAAPKAAFSAPAGAPVNTEVRFDASASSAQVASASAGEGDLSYRWDFGDGTSTSSVSGSEGQVLTHTYAEAGHYLVTLTVTSPAQNNCNQGIARQPLLINAPPVAVAGEDRAASVAESLLFDASASSDPDGAIREYAWDFGDSSASSEQGGQRATGIQTRHRYAAPGRYEVTLTVQDNADLPNSRASDSLNVTVNAPPLARFELDQAVYCANARIDFDASPSGDEDGEIQSWQWDFGDGASAQGQRAEHAYAQPGEYTAVLTVTDNSGQANQSAQTFRRLRINQPPQPGVYPPRRVCPGPVEFDAAQAADPDGKITALRWNFGDGSNGAEGRHVRHDYPISGQYTVRLAVEDDSASACATASAEWPLHVNATPQAQIVMRAEQVFSGGAHDAVLFDASGSSDADHDPLRYQWEFSLPGSGKPPAKAEGAQVWYTFPKPGRYKVTLRASDDSATPCASGMAELTVEVQGR